MKKEYESPKAEKMEFNYSETVVASGSGCGWRITKGDYNYVGCEEITLKTWAQDTITG